MKEMNAFQYTQWSSSNHSYDENDDKKTEHFSSSLICIRSFKNCKHENRS